MGNTNGQPDNIPDGFEHINGKTLAEHWIISLGYDTVRGPDNKEREYTWVDIDYDGVYIIALDENGKLPVLKRYSPKQKKSFWELPGGGVEGDEGFVKAAKRELYEEAGYEAKKYELLDTWPVNGHIRAQSGVVVAHDINHIGTNREDGEFFLDMKWVTPDQLGDLARRQGAGAWLKLPYYIALDHGIFDDEA